MGAGGDIEKNHLVGALLVIAHGQLDRITDVAQLAGFGLAKLHAARDPSVMHVQAWNDPLCQHCPGLEWFSIARARAIVGVKNRRQKAEVRPLINANKR